MIDLYHGDCLDEMDKVPDHTVNMIFTDLPYGATKNAWDVPIPLDQL
jgi:DNA modification methylase|nr:MAG TPA: adenine-specific methyltransferase [Caudoviricetes sp.]